MGAGSRIAEGRRQPGQDGDGGGNFVTLADILKQDSSARISSGKYWLVWDKDEEQWEIYSRARGKLKTEFNSARQTEAAIVNDFLALTREEAVDNPAPPAKSS